MSKGFLYDEGDELITRKEDVGGLPDTSEASAGDVLSLDSDKEPVWSAPSGGGGGFGILIDATGEYTPVTFNEDTYSGTPISGSLADYIDAVESGKMLIIVTEPNEGVKVYSYPVYSNPVEAYNLILLEVYTAGSIGEAFIGYPTEHPNDLYYMIEGQQ